MIDINRTHKEVSRDFSAHVEHILDLQGKFSNRIDDLPGGTETDCRKLI